MEKSNEVNISTNDGQATFKETQIDDLNQSIIALSIDEKRDIDNYSEKCILFLDHYGFSSSNPSLEDLDLAFIKWQQDMDSIFSDDEVSLMIGSYLGNYLSQELNMKWIIVNDQYGTDYAVQSNEFEVMTFPISSVQKRIETEENDFIKSSYITLKYYLDDERSKRK